MFHEPNAKPAEPLTPTEHRALELVAEGFSNAQIGTRIFRSEHGVKNIIERIHRKIPGARNRTHLVTKAHEMGLLGQGSNTGHAGEDNAMSTDTDLHDFSTYTQYNTLRDGILDLLGGHDAGFDIDGMVKAYRNSINAVLNDDGITLAGEQFYSTHPVPSNSASLIRAAIASVDFAKLAEEFAVPDTDQTATGVLMRPGSHSPHNLWVERPGDPPRGGVEVGCVFDIRNADWISAACTAWLNQHPESVATVFTTRDTAAADQLLMTHPGLRIRHNATDYPSDPR